MPNSNGSDFIKMIRNIDSEIPILIVSMHIENTILQQSINYGIQGYIQKPINENTLKIQLDLIKSQVIEKNLIKEYQNITNASAIISKINKDQVITYVNEQFCKVSGYQKEELVGQNYEIIKFQEDSPNYLVTLWHKILHTQVVWTGVLKHRTKSGLLYYLQTTIQPIININGEIEQFITLSIPITNIIHPEEQLDDYLKQHPESILFLIKIEEFKYLEHSFTRKITKKLQKLFAKELLKYMPEECRFSQIYLLNNGKFAFVKQYDSSLDMTYLVNTLKKFQIKVNNQKIKIGIVNYTLSIVSSLAYGQESLENAKLGLRKILKTKEEFIVARNFKDEMTKESNEKLNKFMMLKEAIDNYNIVSYFQPIVNNKTLKIKKYESLVRLIDRDNNILSPYHFLEIAKEGKYYHKITSITLQNSFRALYNTETGISINLSALDIEDTKIQNEFYTLLEEHKSETHRITIELVEDEKINNKEMIQHFIQKVKQYGIKISLDDFGKGFSNFSRVQSYQPNYIKIDGSLIRNIEQDKFSQDLVETIVFVAKKQNIETIAEFVENENIFNILKNLGVDYSQGYYFSKAALLEEFLSSTY
ncbi:MAG: diguanylate cyclase/phosphodiesterase (GGDEF & EAL domains) with PAS/PAC sensor(s) [uncultured Sulfurovum sp.]|uniref:Diguanylate cyclase/phosphodiesterase (GGDEF & EAL domains) with PAS/PAC sensor(S) n=1 Tax=uncultured Sulfurovum sp. TaxID=269237 RepID=A0A6S6U366_9BACT|nr:MAG: diguanylate cyclase/phosphodiesterase (GGDEF & EAL domains) with PAS/PAC sensor(s) [uncultured Sulfurovum sp.]